MKVSIMKPVEKVPMFLNSKKIHHGHFTGKIPNNCNNCSDNECGNTNIGNGDGGHQPTTKLSMIRAMPLSFPFWAR